MSDIQPKESTNRSGLVQDASQDASQNRSLRQFFAVLFAILLVIWALASFIAPTVAFCITRSPLSLALFPGFVLLGTLLGWVTRRFLRYLLPLSKDELVMERERVKYAYELELERIKHQIAKPRAKDTGDGPGANRHKPLLYLMPSPDKY